MHRALVALGLALSSSALAGTDPCARAYDVTSSELGVKTTHVTAPRTAFAWTPTMRLVVDDDPHLAFQATSDEIVDTPWPEDAELLLAFESGTISLPVGPVEAEREVVSTLNGHRAFTAWRVEVPLTKKLAKRLARGDLTAWRAPGPRGELTFRVRGNAPWRLARGVACLPESPSDDATADAG